MFSKQEALCNQEGFFGIFLELWGLSTCKYIVINDHINRNVLIYTYPSTTYIPQLRKLTFPTKTSNYTDPKEEIDPLSFPLPLLFSYSKKGGKYMYNKKGKSSSFSNSFIHRRIIPDFHFPSSDEETVSLFRTITFRLNRPLSSGLITFTGLSVFSRSPGSVALAFPAALLLLLLGEVPLLLATTDVVSLLETGDGLAALLLLLLPEVSFVLPSEIVRWRITGTGKLSFLSIALTVR